MNKNLICHLKKKIKNLPALPGVYFFYDIHERIIYIGKAAVLKTRVMSYFSGNHDIKTKELITQISDIKYRISGSVIEALILESNLIKKYQPKYNIREKDDKSFVQIVLTDEEFPRLVVLRPTQKKQFDFKIKKIFGPYTNSTFVNTMLSIFRKIFTFRDCTNNKFKSQSKKNIPCIYYNLGLCPAPCVKLINKQKYNQNIKLIINFLEGKTKQVIRVLKLQMQKYAKYQEYEQAALIRNQLSALKHINDVALIKQSRSLEQIKNIPHRIEAYDISNLGASYAVGSMVVFTGGEIDKNEYRKFKIIHKYTDNTDFTNNKNLIKNLTCLPARQELKIKNSPIGDPQMLAQIVERRFNNDWPKPDLIILDGGKGQLSAVTKILKKIKTNIPIIAVAKGPTRKGFSLFRNNEAKNIILNRKLVEQMRDEAHRFAITYHRKIKNTVN